MNWEANIMAGDSSQIWPAPAKLNLFLHVTGRRDDGYHELQTVFQLLDYGDELQFSVSDDGVIERSTVIETLAPEHDIVVKAAHLLARASDCRLGAKIALRKRIPMGAGLGGGSSDAATTLLALNRLWQLNWDRQRLARLALQLGADVPVFVAGHSAWAEGVGETLEPLELPDCYYLVVTPAVHVSTAEMFSDPNLTRDHEAITIRDYFSGAALKVCNDFEPLLRNRYREIADALDWLTRESGITARVSGTGASIFVALADETILRDIAARLPKQWSGFVARSLNRSPLLAYC